MILVMFIFYMELYMVFFMLLVEEMLWLGMMSGMKGFLVCIVLVNVVNVVVCCLGLVVVVVFVVMLVIFGLVLVV